MVIPYNRLIAVLLLLTCGCSGGISDRSLVYVTPSDAALLLQEGESSLIGPDKATILVDPRPTWSYAKAHIQGSINIPFGRLRLQSWMLDEAGIIVVSGGTYNDSVALAMSKQLLKLGFSDVRTLRGGLAAWEDAGEAVVTAE